MAGPPIPGRYHPANIEEEYTMVPGSEDTGLEIAINKLEKLNDKNPEIDEVSIAVKRRNDRYEVYTEYVTP